jgi:hypothetical protein
MKTLNIANNLSKKEKYHESSEPVAIRCSSFTAPLTVASESVSERTETNVQPQLTVRR